LRCSGASTFFGWFGFNFVSEQFYAFSLDPALSVVFLSVRIDRTGGGRGPWYDFVLAAIAFGVLIYIGANFLLEREFRPAVFFCL